MSTKDKFDLTTPENDLRMLLLAIINEIRQAKNCKDIAILEQYIITKVIEKDLSNEILVSLLTLAENKHNQIHAQFMVPQNFTVQEIDDVFQLQRDTIDRLKENELDKVRNKKAKKIEKDMTDKKDDKNE